MIVYVLILTFKGYTFNHSYNFAMEEYCKRAGEAAVKEGIHKYKCVSNRIKRK